MTFVLYLSYSLSISDGIINIQEIIAAFEFCICGTTHITRKVQM